MSVYSEFADNDPDKNAKRGDHYDDLQQAKLETAYKKRLNWFLHRIGKKVYRGPVNCDCESCKNGHINGVLITDAEHAQYLRDVEAELRIRYSDIKRHS